MDKKIKLSEEQLRNITEATKINLHILLFFPLFLSYH
jgi:hypothetical protein